MNIGFLVYNWENIDPAKDSTLRLIHESVSRNYITGILYPNNLTIRNNEVFGFFKIIEKQNKVPANFERFYKKATFKKQLLPLRGFDILFVRKDPPLDHLALNFLDSVAEDVFIINDINGIRKANNKTYTTVFNDPKYTFIPETYVSKNKEYLKSIIDDSKMDKMILKPLNGYGGSGVIVLEKSARQNIASLLDFYINGSSEKNYVILQEYIEGAEKGDIRVLMLNGVPIGAMKRIPGKDEIRSNVHAGGQVAKHTLTKQERLICNQIGPRLVKDGLYFAGIDIIGNKLVEINVLSPGGIVNINRLNKARLQKKILDFAEEKVSVKETALNKKLTSREFVINV